MEAATQPAMPALNPTYTPRRLRPLVAWIRRMPGGSETASKVHYETAPGSGQTRCGVLVPPAYEGDDRATAGVFRGDEDLDDVNPHWPECGICDHLTRPDRR